MELIIVDINGKVIDRQLFLDETSAQIEAIKKNYVVTLETHDRLVVIQATIH